MKSQILRFYQSSSALRTFLPEQSGLKTPQALRKAVAIAAIDDQPFHPQTNLRSYGYSVQPIGDIKNVSEVEKYQLILCDIMGVGRHFSPTKHGASIISEIKKAYPEKVVIAYTGAILSDPAAQSAAQRADRMIKKDIDIEEWIAVLDEYAAQAVDPYIIWQKVRHRLVELSVDTRDILLLEDSYVRDILNRRSTLSTFAGNLKRIQIGEEVRAILTGLITSTIFAAISGHH